MFLDRYFPEFRVEGGRPRRLAESAPRTLMKVT